ncbi:hypothetical protein COU74_04810 [Candidatus Peregrinibacteria bacterium CG10_big_fil_rev_8_21_14_0_10_36_19]|nr:MAG: hypothetical protein COU74_04810 [Candidatus Peregrinibacteria bacterium CG10_big_fil_rev_8_21_14_0_10_36_19]
MSLLKKLTGWTLLSLVLFTNIKTPTLAEFTDVDIEDPHYVAISYLQEQGIISGYEDGSFKPYKKVNRAEALKMLTLASGVISDSTITILENPAAPFTDTPPFAWYTKYLIAAKEKGIINGYEDGTYQPESNVKLIEALKIFLECFNDLEYPDPTEYSFADSSQEDWYAKYVAYSASKDMLTITAQNEILPEQEMTRGELAEIIYRKYRSKEGYGFGKATYYGAAAHGRNTASGETFDKDALTAAHKTLPFGTIVEVTNLANGKSIQVKITDRGPYGPGRVIDLSSGAFKELAPLSQGVMYVQYKVIE